MLSATNEKYCSSAQLNQKVFKARGTRTRTSSMSAWRRGLQWRLNAIDTGANTPREIKLSFRPRPLLNTRSFIEQLRWRWECVRGWEQEAWQDEGKGLRNKAGKLIYLPLMMVSWHQICATPDLFTARLPIRKVFLFQLKTQLNICFCFENIWELKMNIISNISSGKCKGEIWWDKYIVSLEVHLLQPSAHWNWRLQEIFSIWKMT